MISSVGLEGLCRLLRENFQPFRPHTLTPGVQKASLSSLPPGLPQHFPPLEWAHVITRLPFLLSVSCRRQVSERRLRPVPQKQRTLHEKILEEIKQERRLRPVGAQHLGARGEQGGEGE